MNALEQLHAQHHDRRDEFGSFPRSYETHFDARMDAVRRYAWGVPNEEAIKTIASLSPIVEVGAGNGYWANLLREAGAEIEAFDIDPFWQNGRGGYRFTTAHFPVARGGVERAMRMYGDRTLFLCWPPYSSGMAHEALLRHRGEHVAYVGEYEGGCTADGRFHVLLETWYEQLTTVAIPQWWGLHDYLTIWRRR